MSKSFHCPKCKSQDIHCMITNETSVSSTGGGYGAGKGCLGYLLLGPLGLLCGACGSKQKITTENHQTTVWACKSCGEKFRDKEEIESQISNVSSGNPGVLLFLAIIFFLVFWFFYQGVLNIPGGFGLFISIISCAIIFIPPYFISKNQQKEKLAALYRELNYITKNAYSDE